MATIKNTLNCIGVSTSGSVSVLRDLFGFFQGRVPPDETGAAASVSVKQLLSDLKGKHLHLNIIRTGVDIFSDPQDFDRIDWSILRIREIYRAQDLTVGRVQHWDVTTADSDGLHNIASADEATELTNNWSVDNDGQDVFLVVTTPDGDGGFVGISNINGPCDKDLDKERTGSIVGLDRSTADKVARTFAHEIGHYLGLSHKNNSPDNLMCQTSKANSDRNSVDLTNSQGTDIRNHCSVTDGC
ncbi:MAG: matrixin family metalloprotease [Dinghuibacter sp.]|nr:matrixin family metalloprotease [Dinghuibacter sp.]